MTTITTEMFDKCLTVHTDILAIEQEPLLSFMNYMLMRSKNFPEEATPKLITYLGLILYQVLKECKCRKATEDEVKHVYSESKKLFVLAMWYEEFLEEQPVLYSIMVQSIRFYVEDGDDLTDIFHYYMCTVYSLLRKYCNENG